MGFIYVDGAFDLFHEGHINLLKRAASYGKVIVGIHDDDFVASYKRRPYIPQQTRYEVVRACRYVERVIEGVGMVTDEMIEDYQIELVIHGNDFNDEQTLFHYKIAIERGILKYLPYTKGISSTQLIRDIESRFVKQ